MLLAYIERQCSRGAVRWDQFVMYGGSILGQSRSIVNVAAALNHAKRSLKPSTYTKGVNIVMLSVSMASNIDSSE